MAKAIKAVKTGFLFGWGRASGPSLLASLLFITGCGAPASAPTAASVPVSASAGAVASRSTSAQSSDSTAAQSTVGNPAGSSDWQAQWDQTVARANAEGAVSVFSSALLVTEINKFKDAYPNIKLELVTGGTGDFDSRVATERQAGQHLWDAVITGPSQAFYAQQIPAGWYSPLKDSLIRPDVLDDSKWLGGFDAGFMDKGKKYSFGFTLKEQWLIWVNKDVITDDIQSFDDLLKPQFKGKIAIIDPQRPSSGTLQLAAILKALGPDGLTKLLVDQQPGQSTDRRQVTEWVVRGQYPIGIGVSSDMLRRLRRRDWPRTSCR